MMGEVHVIGGTWYAEVNSHGTLQKLPKTRWWKAVWWYIISKFRRMSVCELIARWEGTYEPPTDIHDGRIMRKLGA